MNNISATISGVSVTVIEGSLQIHPTLDGRSTAQFVVKDLTGTQHYQFGQPVTINDSVSGESFTGYVNDSQENVLYPNACIESTITCVDDQYIPSKRYYTGPEYTNRFAGDIASDLLANVLAPEGITAAYAVDNDQSQAQWQQGALTGVVAANNINGGDLELSPAGQAVNFLQVTQANFNAGTTGGGLSSPVTGGVTFTPTPAIKFQATEAVPGVSNPSTFVKIWDKSIATYTIPSSFPTLFYDIWVADSCPQQMASVELVCTDGTSFVATPATWNTDQQGLTGAPSTDLAGIATNQWYSRSLPLYGFSSLGGKTLAYVALAFGGSNQGTYTAYFRNIKIAQFDGVTNLLNVFSSSATALPITPQQLQDNGYNNMSCTFVTSYERHGFMASAHYDLSPAAIAKSSFLTWNITLPNNNFTFTVTASINQSATFLPCKLNAPIPGLVPGQSLAGQYVVLVYVFDNAGNDPTLTPFLSLVEGNVQPAYSCVKSDIINTTNTVGGWNAGTLTNLVLNGTNLQLNGFTRNWDNADFSSQTQFGTTSPNQSVLKKQFQQTCGTGSDCRSRLDFAGNTWQNFIMECDIILGPANTQIGLVWRCTGWQNLNDTYAYSAYINTSGINFARGTNTSSGSGGATSIASVALTLSSNTVYRLKVNVNGNNHQIYLNDVLYINQNDATYPNAGYVGLRLYNGSGSTQTGIWDNFGIVSALSGTWVSPAIDIHSLASISNSQLLMQIDPGASLTVCTFLAEISLNNGSTWTSISNINTTPGYYQGLPVPGLTPGTNVSALTQIKLRVTISTTTAAQQETAAASFPVMPMVSAITLFNIGAYSSSGARISEALALTPVGRVGSTLAAWTALQPTNTTVQIDTSLDGTTWTNIGSGASGSGLIAGINTQPDPTLDPFNVDTSANYTSTFATGGAAATWTVDTAHSRINASGGTFALRLFNTATGGTDLDVSAILDYSETGGLCWRWQDASNLYYLEIHDASSGTSPNTLQLFKTIAGVRTQIGATTAISFTRNDPHVFRVNVQASAIIVYMDGVSKLTASDGAIVAAGKAGLRTNGGTAQFYLFRLQAYGDDLTSKIVYSRVRLSSTDPTVTPQVSELAISAHGTTIQNGAFLATTKYSLLNGNKNTIIQILDDLVKKSGNFWHRVINSTLYFQSHQAIPSPWAVTNKDVLVSNIGVDNSNDLYRNNQWMVGGKDVITRQENFTGDGQRATFNVGFPIDSISSILVNSVPQSVGIKGTSGHDWYYTVGSTAIVQDSGAAPMQKDIQTIAVTYSGQVTISVNCKNDAEIARLAAVDNTTGNVEMATDAAGLDKAGMIVACDGLLSQYGKIARIATFTTLRAGLTSGQLAPLFISPFGLFNGAFLITDCQISWRKVADPILGNYEQAIYAISATDGPVVGDWTRFLHTLGG